MLQFDGKRNSYNGQRQEARQTHSGPSQMVWTVEAGGVDGEHWSWDRNP